MTENPILQHQKLTILQQIDELKNWHKQQQSKLNYQTSSHEKKDLTEKGNTKHKHRDNRVKYACNSELNSNSHQNTGPIPNFDDTPVKGVQPNLDTIIVNGNPRQDSQQLYSINKAEKPKFRFLKKGEGIARFRMGPVKMAKSKSCKNINLQQSINAQRSNQNNCEQPLKPETRNVEIEQMPVLQPPDLKLDFKNWKSIFNEGNAIQIIEHAIDNNQLDIFQPNSSIDSSTASIMEKLLTIGRKHLKEKEEMRVFETIEQHILDSSFCSTSSYVTRLMENAVVSTPEKINPSYDCRKSNRVEEKQMLPVPIVLKEGQLGERAKLDQKILEEQNEVVKIPVWTNAPDEENENNKLSMDSGELNLEQSLHVRFNEEVDYNSFVEFSQYSSNSKENNVSKTFEDSEEWKVDSSDGSICCSQCDSEDEDVTLVNPHVKTTNLVNNEQINEKKQIYTQKYKQDLVEKLDIKDLSIANPPNAESKTLSREIDTFSPILNTKLKELENEIEAFRSENNKVKLIREKLEKEHKQFQLEKKKFLKEIEEESKRNANQLEEEKQKLSKEKLIFEKYSKSLTKKPSKEERKEIQALREQLSEMKEEFNKKESRWGAAQARVRNQIKLLEEDNKKLREEVEVLRKQAKNLQILTQQKNKRTINNTKLIHAINDHITTIGPVSDDDALIDCGYFKPSSNGVKTVIIEDVDPKIVKNVKVVRENVEQTISTISNKGQNRLAQLQSKININGDKKIPNNDNLSSELISNDEMVNQVNSRLINEIQRRSKSPPIEDVTTNTIKEIINEDGSVEQTYPDGKKEIRLKNGNVKKIDTINGYEKTIYFNGDVKELTSNGTVKYYFSESRIWHTTLPDGLEVLDFPDGQVEKRHTNGTVEIIYPNDCKKISYPDGVEEIFYADGTSIKIEGNKRKVLSLPNGQKEIHTDESIRREYPDGTVKIVYPDGTTETVYSNGRVRLKDKHGNLVMDSGAAAPVKL